MTTNQKPVKAIVAQVRIGSKEIEGLMLPDGTFAVSVSQVASLFVLTKSNATREIKVLLGGDLELFKIKSELSGNPVNVITLDQFTKVVYKLAKKGNKEAEDFAEILFEMSIHQLFADFFNIKFEKEDRQQWLKERQFHRKQYHPCLTKWLQIDGCKEGFEYAKQVNLFKLNAGCPLIPVDKYNSDELHLLNNAEVRYDVLRRTGMTHQEAIKHLR